APLIYFPLKHALHKQTRLGFYLLDHFPAFLGSVGILLGLFIVASFAMSLASTECRSKETLLFMGCFASYLGPLVVGAPPGVTDITGYLLMGIYFGVLCTLVVMDRLLKKRPGAVLGLFAI